LLASDQRKLETELEMRRRFYLSLGSNLGDRKTNLREAIRALGKLGEITAVSSFYETEPVEVVEQPWFLNCTVALDSDRTPIDLLHEILALEKQMGRYRTQDKGPRNIDIDILLAGDAIVGTAELTVPHPAMHERRFVLEPLAEIAPGAMHPGLRKKISELLADLPPGPVVRRLGEAPSG
jgi:2-amino-4-hydroxy-6-hydroxymethyldihydropteridine diphosphokinase